MTLNLLLDSNLARQKNGNQVSHDFTINFNPPIHLDEQESYKAALNKLVTMSYSWYNIAEAFDDNKIRWRKKSENCWRTLTFPDGMYSYSDINSYLQAHTGRIDPEDKNSELIFTLYFNMTVYRVAILIHKDYELDLSRGEFAKLVGFKKAVFKQKNNYVGNTVPDITRSVDWMFPHCDLITRQANDVGSDVLFSFSTVNLQVSYPFQKEPYWLEWHPVNKSHINAIRIWVSDGGDNILDLNGPDVADSIMIEEQ